jgi:hypothetical protein
VGSLWRNYKLRIKELSQFVTYFDYGGYPGTAEWVRHFADGLAKTKTNPNLEREFEELVKTFQREFENGDTGRSLLFGIVRTAILASLRSAEKRKKVLALYPLFEEAAQNSQNLMPIIDAFKPFIAQGNMKMRYYGMCLIYLFNSEGVFDAATRIIYGMVLIALEQPVPADLFEMNWRRVRKGLLELKVPADLIFEGWLDGRIRNAIAHLRFSYDDATAKMRFRDRATRYQPAYDAQFTIYEFSKISLKLDNPFHLVLNLLFIIRIMNLVFTRDVEDAGKSSIFKKWKIEDYHGLFQR